MPAQAMIGLTADSEAELGLAPAVAAAAESDSDDNSAGAPVYSSQAGRSEVVA